MDILVAIKLAYALLGFGIGLLVGMTGGGGGSVMTPLLILCLASIRPLRLTPICYLRRPPSPPAPTAPGSLPATALTLFVLSNVGVQNKSPAASSKPYWSSPFY